MLPSEGITVTEFITVLNQTLDYAYPQVVIIGELANFRISKNKWVYFDLKDEMSSLKFFGTVYQLRQPLEEGMLLKVTSLPRLHNVYGFSMQIQSIDLVGEGSLRRAAELVQEKLTKEGLFDIARKRNLVYPPNKIGLITSAQSAAYADFIKIINDRWRGVEIRLLDVQVQGEPAVEQIIDAISLLNNSNFDLDVIVIIRGGGSPEDLSAFNSESLTRAVAGSKIPTLVAVGHEIDVSLAELASDKRASTPSNAAELLVPDRKIVLEQLKHSSQLLNKLTRDSFLIAKENLKHNLDLLDDFTIKRISDAAKELANNMHLLEAYNPKSIMQRGYSIVFKGKKAITSSTDVKSGDILDIRLAYGSISSKVNTVKLEN
jgi:exodeoxyribonuclease VII large subunit